MKKKIILAVIAIIAIAAVAGVVYLKTDLFKTPEQLFYKYFASSIELTGNTNYEEFLDELKEEAEKPLEVEGELTLKIISGEDGMATVSQVLEKGKIKYNSKTNGKEQKAKHEITLNYDNKDIVTLNVLQNKEQYGIKIAEAYNKYVSVENNNLKALFQKLGIDSTGIPNKIETIDYYELLNVDNKTIKHIKETYMNVLKESISTESYSVEKDLTVKIDEENISANAYKLTLTEAQMKNVIAKILETLKEDDITLDLIVSKYNKVIESYGEMIEEEKITKEALVKEIENALTDLNGETVTDNKMIELVIYSAGEGKSKIEMLGYDKNEIAVRMGMTIIAESENKAKVISSLSADGLSMETEVLVDGVKTDCTLKVNSEGTYIEIKLVQEIKNIGDITIEEFNTSNSVKLNDMTQDEIGLLVQDIYTNVMNALPQKMQLLGINI